MMPKIFVWTLLASLLVQPTLAAIEEESAALIPQFVISAGVVGGGYWGAGNRMKTVAAEMDLNVEVLPSEGSLENLSNLFDEYSPVNLAFAQADALQFYLNRNPTERSKLELLENLGQECVFIVTAVSSKIRTEEDLQDADNLRLGISSPISGVATTFDYMVSQNSDLEDVEVVYGDIQEAMDKLTAADAPVDAVMMVSRPREHIGAMQTALDNPHRYRFVELEDDRFTKELPDGRRIYRGMRLALPGAAQPVKTICVRGLLLVNKKKLSGQNRNLLTDLISYHWMRIYATP